MSISIEKQCGLLKYRENFLIFANEKHLKNGYNRKKEQTSTRSAALNKQMHWAGASCHALLRVIGQEPKNSGRLILGKHANGFRIIWKSPKMALYQKKTGKGYSEINR